MLSVRQPIERRAHERKGVEHCMAGIRVREEESFERALRRFNKACEKSGIMSDIKKNQHFEKPSDRRKRKMNQAIRRNRKKQQRRR
jgi:small subunit ribosomal protein S21